MERKVIDLVHRFGLERRVLISSFNPGAIRIFRRELPEAPAMLLLLGGWKGRLELPLFGHWALPDLIGMYHRDFDGGAYPGKDGRRVMVWGPENEQEVGRMAACGVDGVIVDDPRMALKALAVASIQ